MSADDNVNYVEEIENLIRGTMGRFTSYKEGVTGVNRELTELLDYLRRCIERLMQLLTRYNTILTKSQGLKERLKMAMEEVEGEKRRCKDKLKQIYDLFTQSITDLGTNDTELDNLKQLTKQIKTQIEEICAEIDKKLRETEGKGSGDDSGPQQPGSNDDTDSQQDQDPEEVEVEGLPAGWTAYRDPNTQNLYYSNSDGTVTQWDPPGSEEQGQSKTTDDDEDRIRRAGDHLRSGLREGFDDRLDPGRAFAPARRLADKAKRKKRLEGFQEEANRLKEQGLERGERRAYLGQWFVENDTDNGNNEDAFSIAERRSMIDAVMNDKQAEEGLKPQKRRSSFQGRGGSRRKRRVTRKKHGGWQTPQKLESISRYSPIRRVERKKKKNKKRNTKKNKKRRRRKQTKKKRKKRN